MSTDRKSRAVGSLVVMLVASLGFAASANADHHFMKIREFFPGTVATTRDDAFLELQMYAAGQNVIGGHHVHMYSNGADAMPAVFTFSAGSVPNGENQRTILAGGSLVTGRDRSEDVGSQYDETGGALCFVSSTGFGTIDCVEWGTGNNTVDAGTPVSAAGIPDGSSVTRTIAPNCPTLLEAADDTENSATDFAQTAPSPRNNATTPTETECTGVNPTVPPPLTAPVTGTPFNLAAAIKRCKKRFPKGPKRKRCIRKAKQKAAAA